MRKQILSVTLAASLALAPAAAMQEQTGGELFDLARSKREVEIMKGILRTTLEFVSRELREPESGSRHNVSWRFSNINGFYLYGQGAVFTVPATSLGSFALGTTLINPDEFVLMPEAEIAYSDMTRALEAAEWATGLGVGRGGRTVVVPPGTRADVPALPAPPEPPSPVTQPPEVPSPAPPAPPGSRARAPQPSSRLRTEATPETQEEMRARLAELQEKVKKQREEAEQRRARKEEMLEQVREYLIETLANHGDSLTQVRPNEYITILLVGDLSRMDQNPRILSVQKSFISDYKAGRLNLQAFRDKVLDYTN